MVALKKLGKKRILVISDIHGQLDKFLELLKKAKYDPKEDQLILLGDYVDRGTQNFETLATVMYLQSESAIILKGNHDSLCQNTIYELLTNKNVGFIQDHIYCGGENTYNELKKLSKNELLEIYHFLVKLPYYYEIDNYIFVHAGVDGSKPLHLNDINTLMWTRNKFLYVPAYPNKIVIFGHTVTYTLPHLIPEDGVIKVSDISVWFDDINGGDKIGVDCGSVFGGRMACLELPSKNVYYV